MNKKASRTTFRLRLNEMVSILRDEIISGRRSPGDYLPSETALGELFSLSKNSVRRGLELLVSESLIEKVPRIGNRVCNPNTEGNIIVRFGYYPSMLEETKINEILEGFYKHFPHIQVQMVPISYTEFYETVPEYFQNGLLDVVTINHNNFQHCLDGDRDFIFETFQENDQLYPFLTREFIHNGKLLVQPFVASPVILCYNKDHFHECSVPEPDSSWSWDDLLQQAAKVSEGHDRFGFFFHLPSDNRWPIFLLQSGMSFERNEAGVYDFSDSRLWDGLELSRKLVNEQDILPAYLSDSDRDTEALFLQEKVSIILTTYYSLNTLKEAKFSYEVASLPYYRSSKTLLTIIGLAVNKYSKVKGAALELINYLLSYEVQLSIRRNTLTIPSHKKAAEWQGEEVIYRPTRFHMYRDIVPSFSSITELGLPFRDLERIRNELKPYWSNMESKESTAARLSQLFNPSS